MEKSFLALLLDGFLISAQTPFWILKRPSLWLWIAIPIVLNLILCGLLIYFGFFSLMSVLQLWVQTWAWPAWISWLQTPSHWLLQGLAVIFILLCSTLLFTLLSNILCVFFNDHLCVKALRLAHQERQRLLSLPAAPSMFRILWLEIFRTCILLITGLLILILGFFPFLQIPAFLMTGFCIAFEYAGYPIAQFSSELKTVWRFLIMHWPLFLGYGIFFALLFAIPFSAIVAIPWAVVSATRLYAHAVTSKAEHTQ